MRWRVSNKCRIPSSWRIFLRNSDRIWSFISKEDFTSNYMLDLDEFALCTHDEADMMIFVHTNYATKVGGPEEVLMAKASDTDIICLSVSQWCQLSERLVYTSCELHMAIPPLEMDSFPWTVRLHWATKEQVHSRLHQSLDVVSTFCDKGKNMWCMWWDSWCLQQIKSVSINSNWRWHRDVM